MLEGCVPWPQELAERYRREGYWLGKPLECLITEAAPARTALVAADGRRWTYGELDEWIACVAAGLSKVVGPRERVVLQLPNIPEFVVAFFALLRVGALPVLALPAHRES